MVTSLRGAEPLLQTGCWQNGANFDGRSIRVGQKPLGDGTQ